MRIDKSYFEEGLDELLMLHNPNGGRPMHPGTLVYQDKGTHEISDVKEDTLQRFFLGYCACGMKVVVGQKRAGILAKMLKARGVEPVEPKIPMRIKLARMLVGGVTS